jgi:hypothetical protein
MSLSSCWATASDSAIIYLLLIKKPSYFGANNGTSDV